jgi:regulator of protease activity HflC (stomatin/prohibitin superfamily)
MNTLWTILQRLGNLLIWWTTIMPWEQAIRVRFGSRQSLLGCGLHWRIPYVDQIYRQSVRLRLTCLPIQTLSTLDGKTITLAGTFAYRIVDLAKLYNTIHHAETTVQFMAMSRIAAFVHSSSSKDCGPKAIEDALKATIDVAQYGLESDGVKIVDYATVKTYRLINDQHYAYSGDNLCTTVSDEQSAGGPGAPR